MLLRNLHAINPYDGFDFGVYPVDVHGWGYDSPLFDELIARIRPRLIIEVGTWKGASALHMADAVSTLGLDTKIICVDTWLGSLEFWADQSDPERYLSLNMRHGFPQTYYQFLANVARAGHGDRIIPFPTTSAIAARWFTKNNVKADLIYVDASHDYEDVLADMVAYWPLVAPGGTMFGDDRLTFLDVDRALTKFTNEMGLVATVDDRHWQITKA